MLKLIVNNSKAIHEDALSQPSENQPPHPETESTSFSPFLFNSFFADFREFSSNLYVFKAKDYNYGLTCEMTLERKKSFSYCWEGGTEQKYLVPLMVCNFPHIEMQRLYNKVGGDEYLHGMLLFQFQLKILEQLFLFCEDKDAAHLILTIQDADLDYLGAYRRFIISEEPGITAKGEETKAVIPIDVKTYDKVIDFMDEVNKNFHQTLWAGQKTNLIFRQYLKRHSVSGL